MLINGGSRILLLIVILWAIFDWSQRLGFDSENKSESKDFDIEQFEPFSTLTKSEVSKMLEVFERYISQEQPALNDATELSEAFQNQQQGTLTSLFVGNEMLVLKAVVLGEQNYALLQVLGQIDNKSEILQLHSGKHYQGYTLSKLSLQQALFEAEDGREIRLRMYELPK